jgi:hypothetical protein
LAYGTNINKQMEHPMNLVYTGVGPKLQEMLKKQEAQNWTI